jgi:hypothetical protein
MIYRHARAVPAPHNNQDGMSSGSSQTIPKSLVPFGQAKVKATPNRPSRRKWDMEVQLYPYLTSVLERGGFQRHTPVALSPGKTRYSLKRRLRAFGSWHGCIRKILTGFEPRTVQPVASHCPDHAIPDTT